MKIYTYSEARQQLAAVLDEASRGGQVRIRRRDGQMFVIQPVEARQSPLDVPAVASGFSLADILTSIREGREGRETEPEPGAKLSSQP
jgi:prevent-host-death family protein